MKNKKQIQHLNQMIMELDEFINKLLALGDLNESQIEVLHRKIENKERLEEQFNKLVGS